MTPEGKVKARVQRTLDRYKVYRFMPVQTGYGAPGLDFHCIIKGFALCIETKAPGKTLSPRQELIKKNMEAAGGKVVVIGETRLNVDDPNTEPYLYSGEAELEAWLLGLLS